MSTTESKEVARQKQQTAEGRIRRMKNEIKLHYYTSMLEKKLKEDMARQTQEKTERGVRQIKSSEVRLQHHTCMLEDKPEENMSYGAEHGHARDSAHTEA